MKMHKYNKFIMMLVLLSALIIASCVNHQSEKANVVEVKHIDGKYQLYSHGKPFYVKGGGLEFGNMESLKENGGNSFRTWRVDNGEMTGKNVLDKAQSLGLMVCMGIEVGLERHGFDYNNEKAVQDQFERIQSEVIELKDHPALLMWGIGNELNLSYTNNKVWTAVNQISKMIHEIDGNHPTTTMLAGADSAMLSNVMKLATDLDLLSFQYYGAIYKLHNNLKKCNYNGPYLVTEWGATGHWEVEKTSWGRPIEENSHQKAMSYKSRYQNVIQKNDHCIGSYVFLWGQKQERTPTWYGLFLEDGNKTETVDVMHYLWKDKWPENRAPELIDFKLNNLEAEASIILSENQECTAVVNAEDHENDSLVYKWEILEEVPIEKQSEGGDFEPRPDRVLFHDYGTHNSKFKFKAPKQGEYRLFVYIADPNGHAATANIPFLVKEKQNIN